MITKQASVLICAGAMPVVAYAQGEAANGGAPPFVAVLLTVLPIIAVAVVVWLILRVFVRKNQKRTDDYIADQKRHNDKVEHLLERIASALEKDEKDG